MFDARMSGQVRADLAASSDDVKNSFVNESNRFFMLKEIVELRLDIRETQEDNCFANLNMKDQDGTAGVDHVGKA